MTGLDATGRSTDDGAGAAGATAAGGRTGVAAGGVSIPGSVGRGAGMSDAGVAEAGTWDFVAAGVAASARLASTGRPHTTAGRSGAPPAACRLTVARPVPGVSGVA